MLNIFDTVIHTFNVSHFNISCYLLPAIYDYNSNHHHQSDNNIAKILRNTQIIGSIDESLMNH